MILCDGISREEVLYKKLPIVLEPFPILHNIINITYNDSLLMLKKTKHNSPLDYSRK